MPADEPEGGALRAALAGALLRESREDAPAFLATLAGLLGDAFGPAARRVEGGLFRKRLEAVELADGDDLYRIETGPDGLLRATETHTVRGIRLKTEPLPLPDLLERLTAALDARAEASEAARRALDRFLALD